MHPRAPDSSASWVGMGSQSLPKLGSACMQLLSAKPQGRAAVVPKEDKRPTAAACRGCAGFPGAAAHSAEGQGFPRCPHKPVAAAYKKDHVL